MGDEAVVNAPKRVDHAECPGPYTMPKRKSVLRLVDQALARPGGDINWEQIAAYAEVDIPTAQWLWDKFGENVSSAGPTKGKVIDGDELLEKTRTAREKFKRKNKGRLPPEESTDALDA